VSDYDVAIIGGGLNGVSIARDAAGRGLRVLLLEQEDIGGGASSASSQLIHGDLALFAQGELLRVRTALAERAAWLRNAPHLVRPLRLVIPAHTDHRPLWLLRSGLLTYDRLAPGNTLAKSATLDLTHHPVGAPLKRPFGTAFAFSEATVDAARLAVLTAVDAAERGATIQTGARCVRAERAQTWRLMVIDRGHRHTVEARSLVNATGAWTGSVAETVLRVAPLPVRLVKHTRIVLPRLFDTDDGYVFQHHDGRLVYATPFRDVTLVGFVAGEFRGDPAVVAATSIEIADLCDAVNRYLRMPVAPVDVIRTMSGANATVPDRRTARDGFLHLDSGRGKAPLITVFGGTATTARRRAEAAVLKLTPFYPMSPRWTATAPLPGGDFPAADFEAEVDEIADRWPFLGERLARRLFTSYGTRVSDVLGDARSRDDLGETFGEDLSAAEVNYLMTKEFARFADDILWRRSKLGLAMPARDRYALEAFMAGMSAQRRAG
jgi:glycerol-3-phosphate dehydrogenase